MLQGVRIAYGSQGGELDVIAAGPPTAEATELLSSGRMRDAMETLSDSYGYVVLDSSPVLPVVDAIVLARYSQGVVLVVDALRSRRRDVRRAMQTLRASEAPMLGFVFNRAEVSTLCLWIRRVDALGGASAPVQGDRPLTQSQAARTGAICGLTALGAALTGYVMARLAGTGQAAAILLPAAHGGARRRRVASRVLLLAALQRGGAARARQERSGDARTR